MTSEQLMKGSRLAKMLAHAKWELVNAKLDISVVCLTRRDPSAVIYHPLKLELSSHLMEMIKEKVIEELEEKINTFKKQLANL